MRETFNVKSAMRMFLVVELCGFFSSVVSLSIQKKNKNLYIVNCLRLTRNISCIPCSKVDIGKISKKRRFSFPETIFRKTCYFHLLMRKASSY